MVTTRVLSNAHRNGDEKGDIVKNNYFDFPVGIQWNCRQCSKCCGDTTNRVRRILLLPVEARQISEVLKIPLSQFCQKTNRETYTFKMKKNCEKKCLFLKNGKCQIYTIRPLICRFYPFWLEHHKDGSFSFNASDECLGIGSGKIVNESFFKELFKLAVDKMKNDME